MSPATIPTIFDSPYYRVSVKAVIFDDQQRLLVFQNSHGKWEMPGGGWEHNETLEECVARELAEEMQLKPVTIGRLQFVYAGENSEGVHKLRIAVPVTVESFTFVPSADDFVAAKFVTREEFLKLPFQGSEQAVQAYANKIWPSSAS